MGTKFATTYYSIKSNMDGATPGLELFFGVIFGHFGPFLGVENPIFWPKTVILDHILA